MVAGAFQQAAQGLEKALTLERGAWWGFSPDRCVLCVFTVQAVMQLS